jgi:hypothetical protein
MKTNYSRRELYALGETLGNSATYKKATGGYVFGSGGGGQSTPAPSSQAADQTVSNIAPWARQGVQSLINSAMQNVYPNMTTDSSGNIQLGNQAGYTPFNASSATPATQQSMAAAASQQAGFSPLQQQSFQGAQNLQVPGQYGAASNMTAQAGQGSLGTAAQAMGYGAAGADIGTTGGVQYGALGSQQGLNYGNQATNAGAVSQYMNPYIQNALAPQLALMNQQEQIQQNQNAAQAVGQGAFGGSRQAVQQGLTQQNNALAQQQAIGQAYNQAYNTANQNMQTAAQLGMQGAGIGLQGVQAQLAGNAQGLQGVGAAQQGYAGASQAGSNLANIGAAQLAAQQGILGLQNQYGGQQQAQQQAILNNAVQQYGTMQQYPMAQLGQLESLYTGAPQNISTLQYRAAPSTTTQLAGLGTTALGASKLLGNKGGAVKNKRNGIVELGMHKAMSKKG